MNKKMFLLAVAIAILALSACTTSTQSSAPTVVPAPLTAQVQFEAPLPIFPTAAELTVYSTIGTPTLSPISEFQPNGLTQSVPTLPVTPRPDSAQSFCGRDENSIFALLSGGKRMEIKYIGTFGELKYNAAINEKHITQLGLYGEIATISIVPRATSIRQNVMFNERILSIDCGGYALPYQHQAIDYVEDGLYRIFANQTYAYYQVIGYEIRYIDNETGRSLDPNAPPANEMVPWPIAGVTIAP